MQRQRFGSFLRHPGTKSRAGLLVRQRVSISRTLKYLREQGFDIEVMSWEHSLNPCLRSWAESNGRSILLNPFYENLTFVDGGRRASSANALYKKVALHRLN
jgi:hypothetical protein